MISKVDRMNNWEIKVLFLNRNFFVEGEELLDLKLKNGVYRRIGL